jgi:hypothetical protein
MAAVTVWAEPFSLLLLGFTIVWLLVPVPLLILGLVHQHQSRDFRWWPPVAWVGLVAAGAVIGWKNLHYAWVGNDVGPFWHALMTAAGQLAVGAAMIALVAISAAERGWAPSQLARPVPATPVNSLAMTVTAAGEVAAPRRGQVFRYEGFSVDAERGLLTCRYSLDGREFAERVSLTPGERWNAPAVQAAARFVYLLAGVSYYKTAAPPVIEMGPTALTQMEHDFLREFYLQGLGEYAYRNNLDLSGLQIASSPANGPSAPGVAAPSSASDQLRPLVPFGGGIDSIVTVAEIRKHTSDVALFVVNRPGDRFAAIERPAEVSGLPVIRAGREIDPQLLRSAELGFLNGHVPVTGIISAIAVLAAALNNRDAVVMSTTSPRYGTGPNCGSVTASPS